MSRHAGLYVYRNREKRNALGYLECLVSIYLHNKIQPILFPFLHRLVWLLNPKPHPPLDGCQSEPQARGELSCVWSVPMQVLLSFFSSPVLWFACFVLFLLFWIFFPRIFFPPSFYTWSSWFGVFFTYMFTLHAITLGCDPKFGSVCYWNIDNNALLDMQSGWNPQLCSACEHYPLQDSFSFCLKVMLCIVQIPPAQQQHSKKNTAVPTVKAFHTGVKLCCSYLLVC